MRKHIHKEKTVVNSIIDATFELMKNKTLDKITITEITSTANVSRISYYRHFNNKIDIIKLVFDNQCNHFLELYPQGIHDSDTLFNIVYKILYELYEDQEYIMTLYNSNLLALWLDSFNELFTRLSLTTPQAYFISGGLYNVLNLWIQQDFKLTPEEILNTIKL